MKNSVQLSLPIHLRLQQKISNLLMNVVDGEGDGTEPTTGGDDGTTESSDRPKVTKIPPKLKKHDDMRAYEPEVTGGDRPKVTKIRGIRKKTHPNDDDVYHYTFDFDIEMNDNSGMLMIEVTYGGFGPVSFVFSDVPADKKTLSQTKESEIFLFGGLAGGEYEVKTFAYMDLGSPVLPGIAEDTPLTFTSEDKLTFGQRIRNFFKRLFK